MRKIAVLIGFVCLMTTNVMAAENNMPGIQVGEEAPNFTAKTANGDDFNLFEELHEGSIVLVFYRGGWCRYCNTQLRELQSRLDDFEGNNARVVAISVDQMTKASTTLEGQGLDFTLISNPEGDIQEAFGLVNEVPEELVEKYKKEYKIDLEAASGQKHHKIAIPATYIIDPDRKIVYHYANEDYKTRASIDDVIAALEELD